MSNVMRQESEVDIGTTPANTFKDQAEALYNSIPAGNSDIQRRCYALAKTKLEEAVMWATKGFCTANPMEK